MSGHRVLSRPGSHQALAQYAAALAMQVDEPALGRFDRLRRNRNRSEYGPRTFRKAEVKEAIDTAGAIRVALTAQAPFHRHLLAPLLEGAWARHHDVRLVDALYIELAKQLDATIITTDSGMAAASANAEHIK